MNEKLTFRQKTIVRILVIIGKIIAGTDSKLSEELERLYCHVQAGFGE